MNVSRKRTIRTRRDLKGRMGMFNEGLSPVDCAFVAEAFYVDRVDL